MSNHTYLFLALFLLLIPIGCGDNDTEGKKELSPPEDTGVNWNSDNVKELATLRGHSDALGIARWLA